MLLENYSHGPGYRALISGASGFIGSHLAEYLSQKNWSVTCLIRPASRLKFPVPPSVRIMRGEMTDPHVLQKAVRGQDYIFHAAAQIRAVRPSAYYRSNVRLTKDLVSACASSGRPPKRFVYISSIAAAGPSSNVFSRPKDETFPDNPTSHYGRTKLIGEKIVAREGKSLPFTIVRPPNVYGPRQQETELLVRLIAAGLLPRLKQSHARTSLIYIRDLVESLEVCALHPASSGQTYYLTDGGKHSWRDIIFEIQRSLKRELFLPLPQSLFACAARIADMLRRMHLVHTMFGQKTWDALLETSWLFSAEKAKEDFAFRPSYSLKTGIRDTLAFYGL